MGPFSQRSSERPNQDMRDRLERDFSLKATYDDEFSPSNNHHSEEPHSPPVNSREERDIRNLGFFKEQERQFTQTEDEEEWQERQSPINFILISGVFIILCVMGWFGYRWANQMQVGEPPVIAAETTPFKVRPENPGGMVIPHQDKLVYGRISPDQQQPVEHLLPAPEQLMAPPSQQLPQPQTFVDANGQIFYAYPVPQQPGLPQQQYQGQQPQQLDPNGGYPQPQDYYDPAGTNNIYQQQQQAQLQPQQMMPVQPMQPAQMQQQQLPPQSAPAGYQPQAQQPMYAPTPAQQQPQVMTQPQQLAPAAPAMPAQGMAPTSLPQKQMQGGMMQPGQPTPLAAPMAKEAPAAVHSDKDTLDQLIEKELSPTGAPSVNAEKATVNTQEQKTKAVSGPYKLQVATVDSKEGAIKEVKRIRNIDTRLFSDKKIFAQEISSLGTKKPSYRVIVDGFSTPNAAAQFSNKLKIHKVKGIVLHQPN